jgi:DNA-binding NarL/FixJ family response regulator
VQCNDGAREPGCPGKGCNGSCVAQSDPLFIYIEHLLGAFPEPQRQAQIVRRSTLERSNALIEPLSERELEVLRLLAGGMTDLQIAEKLVLSPRTVHAHISSIYSKLGVTSRSTATRYAIEHHLG